MSSVKTIYVVTSGSYEDYRFQALFTTQVGADAYIKQVDIHEADVATFKLDENIKRYLRGEAKYCITMFRDGRVYASHDSNDQDMKLQADLLDVGTAGKALRMVVWATSEKHAIKKANARRRKLIKTGEWK